MKPLAFIVGIAALLLFSAMLLPLVCSSVPWYLQGKAALSCYLLGYDK